MDNLTKKFYYLLGQPGVCEPGNRAQTAKKLGDEARRLLARPRDSKGHFIKSPTP